MLHSKNLNSNNIELTSITFKDFEHDILRTKSKDLIRQLIDENFKLYSIAKELDLLRKAHEKALCDLYKELVTEREKKTPIKSSNFRS